MSQQTPPIFHSKKQKPNFQSQIPDHLLKDANPYEKWFMENASVQKQMIEWLTSEAMTQSETILKIEEQVLKTNGRVSTLEKDQATAKESIAKDHQVVEQAKVWMDFVKSKYFVIGVVGFLLFGLPWLQSLGISAKSLFTLLF